MHGLRVPGSILTACMESGVVSHLRSDVDEPGGNGVGLSCNENGSTVKFKYSHHAVVAPGKQRHPVDKTASASLSKDLSEAIKTMSEEILLFFTPLKKKKKKKKKKSSNLVCPPTGTRNFTS